VPAVGFIKIRKKAEDFVESGGSLHPMGEVKLKLGNHESFNLNNDSFAVFGL
jgi:hypothetical protein